MRRAKCQRPRTDAPLTGRLNSATSAGIKTLAERLEQLVVDAADDAKAIVGAVSKNGAASTFANDAIDRPAVIAASRQGLLHRYDQRVIIVDDVAAINGRIRTVVIVIRITIPVAVTIKGRTDPTIIAMMPMMPAAVMLVIAMMATTVLLLPAMMPTAVLLVPVMMPAAVLPMPAAMTAMSALMPVRAAAAAMPAAPALSVSLARHRQARKRHDRAADQARKPHEQTLHEKGQAQLLSGATSF